MHKEFEVYGSPAIKLIEELSELITEVSKGERFGYDDVNPLRPEDGTNRTRVLDEINDVVHAMTAFEAWLRAMPVNIKRDVPVSTEIEPLVKLIDDLNKEGYFDQFNEDHPEIAARLEQAVKDYERRKHDRNNY